MTLAPYACQPEDSRGRLYPETMSTFRSPFQRDRDRIIHSSAFRRLKHKTQVFVEHEGDYYRTRLTHTIEVAQVARTIAGHLGLNTDLAEAVALAHDLGHPPFGHTGEDALAELMAPYGGFDHNAQAIRIVTSLERHYAQWDGLNLTWETLEGIAKGLEIAATPEVHTGLNEFDFTNLLDAKYAGGDGPENMHTERKSHFRTLRDTVLEWEQGGIPDAAESWAGFTARVEAARAAIMDPGHETVIAISSGGAIARMIAALLDCGPGQQIRLQLQMKNCAVNRFVYSAKSVYLHGFNDTPHINAANQERLLTYS